MCGEGITAHVLLGAVRMPNATENGKQTRVGNSGVHKPLPEVLYLISFVGVLGGGSNNIGTLARIDFVERVREAPVKRQDARGKLSASGRHRTTTSKHRATYITGEHVERGVGNRTASAVASTVG